MNASTWTILGVLVPLILFCAAIIGWAGRRVLQQVDNTVTKVESIDTRLVAVETNQNWTMNTIQATDRNTRKAARKVGVLPRDLEQTIERPAQGVERSA